MLVQITESTQQAIERLINLGKIPQKLENKYLANIESRLNFLRKWVKELAPEDKLIKLSTDSPL